MGANGKKVGIDRIGHWECCVSRAYVCELTQALARSGTQRIETAKSLLASLNVE